MQRTPDVLDGRVGSRGPAEKKRPWAREWQYWLGSGCLDANLIEAFDQDVLLMGFNYASSRSVRLACCGILVSAGNCPRHSRRQLQLLLGKAALYLRLYQLSEEDAYKATEALRRAIALNPADSSSWIDPGASL